MQQPEKGNFNRARWKMSGWGPRVRGPGVWENTWGPMENTGTGGNTSSGEKYGVWRKT